MVGRGLGDVTGVALLAGASSGSRVGGTAAKRLGLGGRERFGRFEVGLGGCQAARSAWVSAGAWRSKART